jgi:hypothetical protein
MTAASTGPAAGKAAAARALPGAVGVTALVAVLTGIALSNTTVALQHHWLPTASAGDTVFAAAAAFLGLWLVWFGLRQPEMRASVAGYIGGSLLWIGAFEWTWAAFGSWLAIPPLEDNGMVIFNPGLLLVQATSLIFVALLCVYGTNKDTRCRMFMWFHRTLRLQPGKLTPGYKRQFAKITATETIFLIWFVYVVSLTINDPRLIGYASPGATFSYVLLGVWSVYLISRLLKLRQPAAAFRYAIPTGYIVSIPIDALAQRGFYPAFWVQPLKYPLLMTGMLLLFVAALWLMLRAEPAPRRDP